jgi:polar amino acid transport system substrate-binding protein
MRFRHFSLLALLILTFPLNVHSSPNELKFCYEDENAFPWVFSYNEKIEGLDIRLIKLLETEINTSIQLISLPWKRCMSFLKTNQVDGAFAASFKQERLSMGVYPTVKDGRLNQQQRLHTSSYSLYTSPNSDLKWDGTSFHNLKGKISAQLGFSIIDKLQKLGANVHEVKGPERALTSVLSKLSVGAAIQTDRADFILSKSATLQGQLVKYPVALVEKPYYLMLSFKLTKSHPEFSQTIWNSIEKIRNSETMQKSSNEFWQLMSDNE